MSEPIIIDIMDWSDWLDNRAQRKQADEFMSRGVKLLFPKSKTKLRALDCGAGTGIDSKWLAMRGFHVKAIDNSPSALPHLEKARANVVGLRGPGRIEIIAKDLNDLQAADIEDADLILDIKSLSHLGHDNYDKAITTIKDAMKPGARFLSIMFSNNAIAHHPDMVIQSEATVRSRMAGLDIYELEEEWLRDGSDAAMQLTGGKNYIWKMYAQKPTL